MAPADVGNTPRYWIRPTQVLSAAPGFHRFVWDLHYAPPAGTSAQPGQYPISATPHDTPREPRGPWALPGSYTVRLTVGGKSYTQPLTIKMDPRVKTPRRGRWQQVHAMSVVALRRDRARFGDHGAGGGASRASSRARARRAHNAALAERSPRSTTSIVAIVGQGGGGGRRGGGGGARPRRRRRTPTIRVDQRRAAAADALLEDADVEPTTQATTAVRAVQRDQAALVARWNAVKTKMIPALNARLRGSGSRCHPAQCGELSRVLTGQGPSLRSG